MPPKKFGLIKLSGLSAKKPSAASSCSASSATAKKRPVGKPALFSTDDEDYFEESGASDVRKGAGKGARSGRTAAVCSIAKPRGNLMQLC